MIHLVLVATAVDALVDEPAVRELAAATGATIAYLQVGEPGLTEELDRLAGVSGIETIRLVRLPGQRPAPTKSWVRRVAAHWLREHPGSSARIELGESPVTEQAAPLESPAWEEIPPYRHQVFVCRGPRCTAKGGPELSRALNAELSEHGLGDDDVLVAQTGCLYPCNHAPVMVVQPDDVWYGPLATTDVGALVTEHLIAGDPVERLRRARPSGAERAHGS